MRNSMIRMVAAVLGLLVAGAVSGLLTAPVASAHSALLSSDPAAGAKLDKSPQTVTLTFNESLQSAYAVLNVIGPDNHYWQDGEPTIEGPRISVPVGELGPTGTYTINYRVTSADGHPVQGQRSFELTVAGSGTPGAAVADDEQKGDSDGLPVWPFIAGAAVVLILGLGFVFLRGRRSGAA